MAFDFRKCLLCCKAAIIVLGAPAIALGFHSHLKSSWTRLEDWDFGLHSICDAEETPASLEIPGYGEIDFQSRNCPVIWIEYYFLFVLVTCYFLSWISLLASFSMQTVSKTSTLIDLWFHILASILTLTAAAAYVTSAQQIKDLGLKDIDVPSRNLRLRFLYEEKIVAGVLSALQAIMIVFTEFLIDRYRASTFLQLPYLIPVSTI